MCEASDFLLGFFFVEFPDEFSAVFGEELTDFAYLLLSYLLVYLADLVSGPACRDSLVFPTE